jgi:DNA-binding FadR family transcriptional regulator
VQALADGDGDAAARRVVRHLDQGREFLTARQLERTLGFADAISPEGDDVRLAPQVARAIYIHIVASGWRVGDLLGSEADLLAEHGVSRSVLREALRLLEFNRVVRTRRGPGGGVFVDAPTRTAVVGAMAVYLETRGITAMDLFEVREIVELATVSLAVEKLDDAGVAMLEATLEEERGNDEVREVAQHLHERIADLSANRVLALFLDALTRLARLHTPASAEDIGMTTATAANRMRRIHRRIVAAIIARDVDEARRLMQRHLSALAPMHH